MFNPYYPNYKNYTQTYQNCVQNLERGRLVGLSLEHGADKRYGRQQRHTIIIS